MVETLQANRITLVQLAEDFGLVADTAGTAFPEWQDSMPELTTREIETVEEVKQEYLHLARYDLLEPVVKLVILSPLLKLAGFYRPPFYIAAEKSIDLISQDGELTVRGQIDILVFQPKFWVILIEAKRSYYSLRAAIPQTLAYMMGNAQPISFGFVTNGSEFQFLKLTNQNGWQYSLSHTFSLDRKDDLQQVTRTLRHLGQVATRKQSEDA
ncbi:restriction endonuclease subunit R [Leptothoe spongobia TAU-MAC 1115]|uniref:Restriction endonuclease subunit R n=2 Tax=Leptothoe TaxID=2651725 RepID=A0A947DCN8_9CYAN|nr:restriction endonuclease subunit R [Leptothoe spongobia TAU-MAC 1115]